MTQEDFCQELIDADVVRVDVIPATGSTFPIPFAVQNVSAMKGQYPNASSAVDGASFASAILTVALADGNDVDAIMKNTITHDVTPSREAMGIVRTHTTQIPIEMGFQTLRKKEKDLQGVDFHVVLTTYDGRQYLAYGCPNSSQFALSEKAGENGTMTAKIIVKSMSGLIFLGDESSTSS